MVDVNSSQIENIPTIDQFSQLIEHDDVNGVSKIPDLIVIGCTLSCLPINRVVCFTFLRKKLLRIPKFGQRS